PGIVRYVAQGKTAREQAYLALEWLEGETLAERLHRSELTPADALTLFRRVAEALAAVHALGVVHRDVKPSNIFLSRGSVDRAKLIDFGIARFDGAASPITHSGVVVGSPGYLAPEQARGEKDIDARADVFSLGCVLVRCLTGRDVFVGGDLLAVLMKTALE